MADSNAVRTARSRAHRAGRHNLCLPGRCPGAPPQGEEIPAEGAHDLEDTTEEFLTGEASLLIMRGTILMAAARACDANPTPGMLREVANALQLYRYAVPNP